MLTERIVRDAKPDGKTRIVWDNQVKGLGLRITAKGVKSFILNYRIGGRERRMTLARASEISLKAARKKAAEYLEGIRMDGIDPLEVKQEAREAPTIADGLARFFNEYAPARIKDGFLKQSTFNDYRQQANKYLRASLGRLKIADVRRDHIEKMVAPISGKTIRNRVLTLTSVLFTQFEDWGWRSQNSNPAYGIKRTREEPRDRVLSPSEMAQLAKSLKLFEGQYPVSVAAIRFAALSGLRIGEILNIRYEDINFETGRLVLPDTKTGRRVHDLPEPALAILNSLPHSRCPWIFNHNRKKAITYRTVRKHFLLITKQAELVDIHIHDLRRGYMTAAAASGINSHTLRDLLGHKNTKTADRYIRNVGSPVREARAETTDKIAAMMEG